MEEWVQAITETKTPKPASAKKELTMAKAYPKTWKLVAKIYKDLFVKENWEGAVLKKNQTDCKANVAKHIVMTRTKKLTSDILSADPKFAQCLPSSMFGNCWYLNLDDFLKHADNTWRVNKESEKERLDSQTNDILRLFGIAALAENRDDLMRLGRARNSNRAEADGPLSAADAIFSRYQRQFNDPGLTLSNPDRADYLDSFHEMDPNDDARVAITRTHLWLKTLYFNTVKAYNCAMKKWQKGTGGGSGAPENFCDWGDRDGEIFSNYASSGKGDYLGWIYMLDKDIGYAFNMMNEPPPESSVMEDGDNTIGTKKKSKSNPAEEFSKTFSESMDRVGLLLSNVLDSGTATNSTGRQSQGEQQDLLTRGVPLKS